MSAARVLVTGGSGFIGTNLVAHLHALGTVDVRSIDRRPPRVPEQRPLWTCVDVLDSDSVRVAFESFAPTAICHLAARTDLDGVSVDDYAINTTGVANVIAAARAAPTVDRVLFISTQLVCTPGHIPSNDREYSPPNAYGASKVVGENLVREQAADAFTWTILRPTSIWGPWSPARDRAFFRSIRRGLYFHPKGRHIRKSFGYVGNVVWQLARLLELPATAVHRRMLYLADYEAYDILEWARIIQREFGAPQIRQVPVPVLRVIATAGDGLKRIGLHDPPLTSYRLRNLTTDSVFPMESLHALCGDVPDDLVSATRRAVAWIRAHPTE
jgi:nucleoside-diphosphate-sugar epimerase